ncbi:MAG: ABC-type tungstate transport system periplasmic protein [Bacillota bacterium]|nr:MAG: ABC-type tungstate transport system periplasmic protein [Bacillota bacterium]
MELVWRGLTEAFRLLISGDREVWQIAYLTIRVSGVATLLSILLGIPCGAVLGLGKFPGKSLLQSLVNSAMGLPPVVVGLWISLLLWRSGPLGNLGLMYTPIALVVAQVVIATPRVAALTMAGVMQVENGIAEQITSLGASRVQQVYLILKQAWLSLIAASMAGFGAVVAEVGAAMAVGGNIRGQTRVLSTAIVLEINKGNFDIAIALSFILLSLSYLVALTLTVLQRRRLM